jgi:hypothetical protein
MNNVEALSPKGIVNVDFMKTFVFDISEYKSKGSQDKNKIWNKY